MNRFDHFILNWLPYIERSMPVFLYYLCVGLALVSLGYLDLQDETGWLGWVSVVAGVLCLSMALLRNIRYRSAATTLIAFAMLGRLADYWVDIGTRNVPITETLALFLSFTWVSLLVGLVALVTTDADLPTYSRETRGRWAILNQESLEEGDEGPVPESGQT